MPKLVTSSLMLIFLFAFVPAESQCLTAPAFPSCTGTEPKALPGDVLNFGNTSYFYGSSAKYGKLKLNGGTLIVCGDLTVDSLYIDSGTVVIQPGARFVIGSGIGSGMQLFGNSSIYNYGTLECYRNLSLENKYASALKPNVLINATNSAIFKMPFNYFVINNPYSWLVNDGTASLLGIITDYGSSPNSVCLGSYSQTIMDQMYNRVKFAYNASGPSCISIAHTIQLLDTVTNSQNIQVCLGPSAKSDASCGGCKPDAWGAASLFNNCNGCSAIQVLPLHIIFFKGSNKENSNELSWQVSESASGYEFKIKRSGNGAQYTEIGSFVNHSSDLLVNWTDHNPLPGSNYYQIEYTDPVSRKTYFSEIMLLINKAKQLSVFPNPFENFINVTLSDHAANVTLTLMNEMGRLITRYHQKNKEQIIRLFAGKGLSRGIYLLKIDEGTTITFLKLVKN